MKKPLTDESGEVRELMADDIRAMLPAADVLPAELLDILPKRRPGQRGPALKPAKQLVTLRLRPDVLDAYRAGGAGWQTRMAEAIEAGLGKRSRPRSKQF